MSGPQTPQPAPTAYLIIAPNDSWVQTFANWKTAKGVPTHVANVTWIQNNFPIDGVTIRDKAEQIWTYIHQVYVSGMIPALRWVLLVGNNATIPSRYVYLPDGSEWTGLSSILKPTDFYYAVMGDSDWDDDKDGRWGECFSHNVTGPAFDEIGDWTPELYVGRIPFSDRVNVTSILGQAVQYERNPTSFSATGWDSFLLAGAISNYDEEVWGWRDGDYTDEAELSDTINDSLLPYYDHAYRFYENRAYFWNYSVTNTFQTLNGTAVASGINLFSPALINLAGHGTPTDIQRKYDDSLYPYGEPFVQNTQGLNINATGVAIGDPDNDGFNEIVYTLGAKGGSETNNGTVWLCDGPGFTVQSLIWDLWRGIPAPTPGWPSWPTCVDIGDVWNNGTIAVVVGTNKGEVIIFTFWKNLKWTAYTVLYEYGDPVLCIEVGNADNVYSPGGGGIGINTDIAWGHASGAVRMATCFGGPPPIAIVALVWTAPGAPPWQAVYSIDVGDPDDNGLGEITIGTGYSGATGPTGDSYMLFYIPPPAGPFWIPFTIDVNLGGVVYGLDTGNAANDGFNKVVVGLGDGAIYMYEANLFVGGSDKGTKKTVSSPGGNGGLVRCLRVGYVDDNDIRSTTTVVERVSIIAGNQLGGIRKYHADNSTGFIDWYPIQLNSGPMVTAIDVGELSYTTGEKTASREVAAVTDNTIFGQSLLTWFEWPWATWSNMISTAQAGLSASKIPAFIYADSCLTGAYDYAQLSLAGAFLRSDAIGFIGAMRNSWYYYGPMTNSFNLGLNRYMDYAFWQLFFSGTTNYRPGQTLYQGKNSYITAFQALHTQYDWETYHRKNLLTYALFGDPEVDIFTANPAALVVTCPTTYWHNQFLPILVQGVTGSPLSGATVCLQDLSGSYYQVASTNATGCAVFNLTAPANALLHVTVTHHNYSPHEGTMTVKEWVVVSGITLNYDPATLLLNVTGVMASCPTHGYLNNVMALLHTYTIYSGTTNVTSGQLVWHVPSSTWRATNIPCNSLPDGTYIVYCYFTDTDGTGYAVSSFAKVTVTPLPNLLLILLILIVIILCVIIVLLLLRRRGHRRIEPQRSRPTK